jgi:hypothetical protein
VTIDWETHLYRVRREIRSEKISIIIKGLRLAMPSGFRENKFSEF